MLAVDAREAVLPVDLAPNAPRFHALVQDITEPGAPGAAVEAALERFGRVDALVNNAGIGNARPVTETTDAELDRFLAVNFSSAFRFSREALKVMSAGASIVSDFMISMGDEGVTPRQRASQISAGLGLLRGVVVDQHFDQRARYGRLMSVIAPSPHLLGVGIDEDTAMVVSDGRTFEVRGSGAVFVLDCRHAVTDAADARAGAPVLVSGATVQILTSAGAIVTTGRTDLSGNYITGSGIPTGTYYVRASSTAGHITQLYSGIPCAGPCTIVAGAPMSVVEGSTTAGINFVMEAGGRVSGTKSMSLPSEGPLPTPLPEIVVRWPVARSSRTIRCASGSANSNELTGPLVCSARTVKG